MGNKVICIISNFDKDDDAREIAAQLNCPAYIVDSSGKKKPNFYSTDDPFFAGCFNKSCEIFLQSDATHCLFICSDVKGNIQTVVNRINQLPDTIGVYSPAVLGQGWFHLKPLKYGLRDVPFCEGIIFCVAKNIVREVYPIDAKSYPHAFGVDIYVAYVAINIFGKRVVIDDDINVYHPFGTSYDARRAQLDMESFVNSKGIHFMHWVRNYIFSLRYV